MRKKMKLSYKNARELNRIVDGLPSTRPPFVRGEVKVQGEVYDFFFRDIVGCIKALYGDPDFAPYLVFAPERHYVDEKRTTRLYHDMHTGDWWWSTQVCMIY